MTQPFKNKKPDFESDSKSELLKIENAFKQTAQKIQTIDTETDAQWNNLESRIENAQATIDSKQIRIQRFLLRPAFSFSIVIAGLVVISLIWLRNPSTRFYETGKGQRSTVTLQDSTEITLNYLSELAVDRWSTKNNRTVSLKGEALFNVRPNGTPFILTTDVGTVRVLGTKFNVCVRDGRMEVAVLSGRVKISVNRDGIDSSIILSKDQIAVCAKDNFPGTPGTLPFPGYPGWTMGKLMFYRASLVSVCKELELQFDIHIKIRNPNLSSTSLTGVINSQNPDTALTTLVQLIGNSYRYEDSSYVIY